MAIMDIIKRLEAEIAHNGPPEPARADDFRIEIEREIDLFLKSLRARDLQTGRTWFRAPELELLRDWLTRAVYSRCRGTRPVYNHLLISAEQGLLPAVRGFADRFSAAAAEFFGATQAEFVRFTSVEELLAAHHAAQHEQRFIDAKSARILLIPTFNAEKLEQFEIALESLGIGSCSVILCTSEEDAEAIRNHTKRDSRLGKYLLHRSYRYTDLSNQDICDRAFAHLEADDFKLTKEFREALSRYICAVYPEAVLRKEEFVQDLLVRIEDVRADALRFSSVLTAADVPYSRKAELLEQAKAAPTEDSPEILPQEEKPEEAPLQKPEAAEDPPADPEKSPAAEASLAPKQNLSEEEATNKEKHSDRETPLSVDVISNQDFAVLAMAADNPDAPLEPVNIPLEGRAINVLLLAMSTFPWIRERDCYVVNRSEFKNVDGAGMQIIYGRGQLDPIPKKLYYDFLQDGGRQALDYVIIMRTDEVALRHDILVECRDNQCYSICDVSPIDFFEEQIRGYMNRATAGRQFIVAPALESQANQDKSEKKGKKKKGVKRGPSCAQGIQPKTITPTETFKEVIQAIRDLANSSTASDQSAKLNLYIDIHGGPRDAQMVAQSVLSLLETDNTEIAIQVYTVEAPSSGKPGKLLRSDETIQITDFVSGIHEIIHYGKTGSLNKYVQSVHGFQGNPDIKYLVEALDTISSGIAWCDVHTFQKGLSNLARKCRDIRGKPTRPSSSDASDNRVKSYFELFLDNIENAYAGLLDQSQSVPAQVRWCLNKGFYQQALALIEARIPQYLVQRGIFDPGFLIDSSQDQNALDKDLELGKTVFDAFCYAFKGGKKNNFYFDTNFERALCLLKERMGKQWERLESCHMLDMKSVIHREITWPTQSCIDRINSFLDQYTDRQYFKENDTTSFQRRIKEAPHCFVNFNGSIRQDHSTISDYLILHLIIKEVRNNAMHAGNFILDGQQENRTSVHFDTLLHAIEYYLDLVEKMDYMVNNQSTTQNKETN